MPKTVKARVTFYGDVEELDFPTKHPYWVSINGWVLKLSKKNYEELMYMHEFDKDIGEEEEVIDMTLEEKVKQLELENAKLKRANIKLVKDYNHLHGIATELNKQVKEYRSLVGNFVESANSQLDRTETYVLSSVKKTKESL